MVEHLLLLAAFTAAYLGFALMALSQHQHWRAATGEEPVAAGGPVRRPASRLMIVGALVLAVLRDGPAFGIVLGTLLLAASAAAVALTLSWRPHWLAVLARALGRRSARSR